MGPSKQPEPQSGLIPNLECEPGLNQSTASVAAASKTSSWAPRSCINCNRKKVRCDRKEPCSSCTRSAKTCAYPPPGPRIRRQKKTIMAEMSSRISSLEKSLSKAREEEAALVEIPTPRTATPSPSTQPDWTPNPETQSERSGDDILVHGGSSSQYFNEIILSRVIGEERHIKSVLATPKAESTNPPRASPFNALGIISSPCASILPSSLHPPRDIAARLWRTYVDNVEGCTVLKLLHLPTDEVRIYSIINDPASASLDDLALSFAVYFAATISLDAQEEHLILGQEKQDFLIRFKTGLEQAFAHGDFLDSPTVTGLHALAVYLSALRVRHDGKGIWILNGFAIRMAQSLGLHRDGSRLGLAPFPSEIRRRLWWHLLSRDGRSGEDYGIENTNSLLLSSDVSFPINVDDTDLHPDMERLPPAKKGWTAMTLSLVNIDLARAMLRLAALARSCSSSSPPIEAERGKIIDETRQRVEKWTQYCNPVLPRQLLTLQCSTFLLRKLDFITKLQWILLRRPESLEEFGTEENLAEALALLEPRLNSGDSLLRQYAWVSKAYPQFHVIMYVLWHLCVKPQGPNIDRAWKAVEAAFAEQRKDGSTIAPGSKWAVLMALKLKAESAREVLQNSSQPGREATAVQEHHASRASRSAAQDSEAAPAPALGEMGEGGFRLGSDQEEWQTWDTLLQGFQFDCPDNFWQ